MENDKLDGDFAPIRVRVETLETLKKLNKADCKRQGFRVPLYKTLDDILSRINKRNKA